ncbi:extracellular solute-binding protein [Deinococcus hopiensis]|uniref:Carbohydrate ABC transporter substrate-binding protein, CUT1 family n=1 Tax=Deinococcus hopiensis KR-140 TaxID=695939 RepID=A0A1W1UCV1_9DEIO|nr:extracellular solute-binding protein [Deinococcus hopiensis]SMB78928.1 carbohydrate ABC transporter substrate-binding protein, CUT1 family [Deinococcus hopiensis KR-140]
MPKTFRTALTALLASSAGLAQAQDAIDLWHIQTTDAGKKIIQDAVDRFQKANPSVKVNVSPTQNDTYKSKLKIAVGANSAPCVFMSWGGGPLNEYIRSGQVLDLTPYLNKNAAFKNRILPAAWSSVTFGNKIYGVPAENTAVAVVLYNRELFAKYGLKPPKTWNELLQVNATLKKNGVAAFSLANKAKWPGSMFYAYLVDRIGGPNAFKNAALRENGGHFTDPAFVRAGQMVQELVKAGAFVQGYNGLDYDSGVSRQLLYSGKAAMELMGTWELGTINNENPEFLKKVDFFPFPSVPGGKGNPNAVLGTVGDNFYSVSKSCKNPDAAFKLLTYLIDDQSAQARVADNRLPPVKGLKVSDPLLKRIQAFVSRAPSVQLWYDQELPPQLGELHKDTSQALLGLSSTPQQVATQMETLAKKLLK